jgi:hypothetical protein
MGSAWWERRTRLFDPKLPIVFPPVRDLVQQQQVPLTTCGQLRAPRTADTDLFRRHSGSMA